MLHASLNYSLSSELNIFLFLSVVDLYPSTIIAMNKFKKMRIMITRKLKQYAIAKYLFPHSTVLYPFSSYYYHVGDSVH